MPMICSRCWNKSGICAIARTRACRKPSGIIARPSRYSAALCLPPPMPPCTCLPKRKTPGWTGPQGGEAQAALQGWVAHYATGEQKISLFTSAIEHARKSVKSEPRLSIAHLTLAFLLLERAEVTQGQHPTQRNDIAEAALALSTCAERCETALKDAEAGRHGGCGRLWVSSAGAICSMFVWNARIWRGGLDKTEWAQEMRATLAWRCRSMLSDLAAANDQQEEAWRQAQAAALDLPQESEALLRLARCEAVTGLLEMAAHHYRAGLAIAPFAYTAWPELATVLVALGAARSGRNVRAGTACRPERHTNFCRYSSRFAGGHTIALTFSNDFSAGANYEQFNRGAVAAATYLDGSRGKTTRAFWPVSQGCLRGAATTSSRWPCPLPTILKCHA